MSQKKYDAVEILSKISGRSQAEVRAEWERVQANGKLLDECVGPHEFESDMPDCPLQTRAKYICKKCGGSVRYTDYRWYTLGLEHGRRR